MIGINLKMKQKTKLAIYDFFFTYGWVIFLAIIVILALAYFGVFSPNKYKTEFNNNCLTQNFCESYNLEFSNLYTFSSEIICRNFTDKGDYTDKSFFVDFEKLKMLYPECIK